MSQPTGSTEIPVSQEQAAEAQEDAADQAEIPILEQMLSYKRPDNSLEVVATVARFYYEAQKFQHLDKKQSQHLEELYKSFEAQYKLARDVGEGSEALLTALGRSSYETMIPVFQEIAKHEKNAIAAHTDQPMKGPEAQDYGVEAQDAAPPKAKAPKYTQDQLELHASNTR